MLLVFPDPKDKLPLELHHLEVLPDDPEAWMRACVAGEVISFADAVTDLGWPLVLIRAVRPGGERVLAGFYRFFHFVAAAVVRLGHGEGLDALAPAAIALLEQGRPDFRGDPPVLIRDLWLDPVEHEHA